jgi:hypothetical protein
VRALIPLLIALLAAPAAASDPPPLPASRPHDPDLDLGATCPGGPAADALVAALPDHVKELVVLWPRAGCTKGDRHPAARLTLVDHQGEVLTLTVVLRPREVADAPQDYQLIRDGDVPRAELELAPSADHPHVLVRIAGQAATPREALEGPGDFLDLPSLVAAVDALR